MNPIWKVLLKNGWILIGIGILIGVYYVLGPIWALIFAYWSINKNLLDIEEGINKTNDEIEEFKKRWINTMNLRKRI